MQKKYFAKSLLKLSEAKLKTICLLLLLLITFESFSQVANYSFTQNTGAYAELENPEVLATPTALTGSGSIDSQVYSLPENTIPFPFTFNNTSYTGLAIHANGYVSFGTVEMSGSNPISSGLGYNGVISAAGMDLHALYELNGLTGSISYEVVGDAPNREFVIQWKHFRPYVASNSITSYWDWNFQIRLKEDNTISIVYDYYITGTPSSGLIQVGLRGTTSSDYSNRYSTGVATSNWTNNIAGTGSSNTMTTNSISFPQNGLTMTWSPPEPCTTPISQPSNLVLTIAGTTVNGSFTAANPNADRYIVIRTLAGTTPETPADGTTYATGTGLNGNIISVGSTTSFVSSSLTGNTEYTYTVFAYNSICSGGPFYNIENPLTENITSCPSAPTLPVSSNTTINSFDLSWTAPVGGTAADFHYEIEVATDNLFANQITGSPFNVPSSSTTYTVDNLNNSTKYYYRVKAVSSCNSANSSVGNITTLCQAVSVLNENFDSVIATEIPPCWSKIIRGTGTTSSAISTSSTAGNSAPNAINLYSSGANTNNTGVDVILASPNLTNVNSGTHRLTFKARKGSNADIKLQIGTLSTNDATAVFTAVGSEIELTEAYQQYILYFTASSATDNFIGFKRKGTSTYTNLFIDDVIWEPIPSCVEPINLATTAITPTSATISWSSITEPESGYEYFVSTTATPPTLTDTFTPIASSSIVLTELTSGTPYYFWIRSICSSSENSNWTSKSFTTIPTKPAPWQEVFATSTTVPTGWNTTAWSISSVRGATGSNGSFNIWKNLHSGATTGTFTTINVGPLPENQQLSFDYKQSAFSSPYAPVENWGNFKVQVSTDFGTTWIDLATVTNEAGTGNYIRKKYSLSDYAGDYVSIKITATRTAGDFDLSFDNFQINEIPANPVTSVTVATENELPNTIIEIAGTLQLLATVNPELANQNVTWSIVSGSTAATINQNGLVTAVQNGTVTARATSVEDSDIFGEIQIVITNQPLVFCTPSFPQGVEPITLVEFAGISNTTSALTSSPAYENFAATISGNVVRGESYPIRLKGNTNGGYSGYFKIYVDWNNNGTFETTEGTDLGYIYSSTGIDNKELLSSVDVPTDAFVGEVRMRILKKYQSSTIPACNTESYGQAEDYTLIVSENLGRDDFAKNIFKIYPNPTSSFATVQSDLEVQNITIYNQVGQVISSQKSTQIDLSNVASGIYLIHIDFENGQKSIQKIIKK